MNDWLVRYQDLMRRSRVVSILGAGLMVLLVSLEAYKLGHAYSEIEVGWEGLAWTMVKQYALLSVVGIGFFSRAVLLIRNRSYQSFAASWLICLAMCALYYWVEWLSFYFQPGPDCTPSPGKICFAIYDLRRADNIVLYSVWFAIGSFLRSCCTALLAIRHPTLK